MRVAWLVCAGVMVNGMFATAGIAEALPAVAQYGVGPVSKPVETVHSSSLPLAVNGLDREVATALIGLGDLYRDGKVATEDGNRALSYYRALSDKSRSSSLFAMIAPADLIGRTVDLPNNPAVAEGLYHEAADKGSPDAYLRLGNLYRDGRAVAADPRKAFFYYRSAAEAGSDEGKLRVADMMVRGQGTVRDIAGGLAIAERLGEAGNGEALVLLGDLHRPGDDSPVAKDAAKSMSYYRSAAKLESNAGKLRVGEMTALGLGTAQDVEGGVAIINAAVSKSKDTSGLVLLGYLYSRTDGGVIAIDLPAAYAYFRRAAALGDETGILRAGEMLARGQGTARDVVRGRDVVRRLADKGNTFALISLGDLLSDGTAGPADAGAAADAYERAAGLGRADALLRLGDLFSLSTLVAPDHARAFDFYRRASAAGEFAGALRVGEMTVLGQGTPKNVDAGLRMISELAGSGNRDALVLLGNLYSTEGRGAVAADPAKAYGFYRQAADLGSVTGTLRAGVMLARGQGAAPDVAGGRTLLRKLADAGNPYALVALGDLASDGSAGPLDGASAVADYEKAAALGRNEALVRLGDLYRQGAAVTGDAPKSFSYYRRAMTAGDESGKLRVGEMMARGEGTTQDVVAGLALLNEVGEAGDQYAYVLIGDLRSTGAAGPVDGQAAVAAYEKAAAGGLADALLRLGDLYRDGRGVTADGKRAAEYYLKAVDVGSFTQAAQEPNTQN